MGIVCSSAALGLVYPIDVAATYFACDMRLKGVLPLHSSIVDFLKRTNLYYGVKSLYKGFSLSMLTSVPYYCFALATHKLIKDYADKIPIKRSMPLWYKMGVYFLPPVGASLFTMLVFYPFETIIKNYQISGLFEGAREYIGLKECANELVKAKSLYSGIGTNILRVIIGVFLQTSIINALA